MVCEGIEDRWSDGPVVRWWRAGKGKRTEEFEGRIGESGMIEILGA